MYACMYTLYICLFVSFPFMHTCKCVRICMYEICILVMYVYTYVYVYIYSTQYMYHVCAYIDTHADTYTCTGMRMHESIYVCT